MQASKEDNLSVQVVGLQRPAAARETLGRRPTRASDALDGRLTHELVTAGIAAPNLEMTNARCFVDGFRFRTEDLWKRFVSTPTPRAASRMLLRFRRSFPCLLAITSGITNAAMFAASSTVRGFRQPRHDLTDIARYRKCPTAASRTHKPLRGLRSLLASSR